MWWVVVPWMLVLGGVVGTVAGYSWAARRRARPSRPVSVSGGSSTRSR